MAEITHAQHDLLVDQAAKAIRQVAGSVSYPLAIVTGSGLAAIAEILANTQRILPDAIPHMPRPTVQGHVSGVFLGSVGGLATALFPGRVHLYEGQGMEDCLFVVHLAARMGAKILLITNATGSANPMIEPGDLVMLTDQINLTFRTLPAQLPLHKPPLSPRVASCRSAAPLYDPGLADLMRKAACYEKINLKEGIYVGMIGPNYETAAEAAMLSAAGGDVVGMSTVAETIAARRAGLRVAAVSCVANRLPACGRTAVLTHADVVEHVGRAAGRLKRLISRWAGMITESENC